MLWWLNLLTVSSFLCTILFVIQGLATIYDNMFTQILFCCLTGRPFSSRLDEWYYLVSSSINSHFLDFIKAPGQKGFSKLYFAHSIATPRMTHILIFHRIMYSPHGIRLFDNDYLIYSIKKGVLILPSAPKKNMNPTASSCYFFTAEYWYTPFSVNCCSWNFIVCAHLILPK